MLYKKLFVLRIGNSVVILIMIILRYSARVYCIKGRTITTSTTTTTIINNRKEWLKNKDN